MPTPVDIITLRPSYETDAAADAKKQADLEAKAKLASLSESEPAQLIAAMVEKKLMGLFDAFIKTDPAGRICMDILKMINARTVTAKVAAEELRKMYMK